MKPLICELCSGNEIIKQDGYFVCQHCGTKYTVEEAKKLMIEGTVKIDTSDELKNLYLIARRSKDAENNENAAKYYEMILAKDPTSWEANFYSVYYKTMSCKIAEISTAATNVSNCIKETFILIHENVTDAEERKKAVLEVRDRVKSISDMLFNAANVHMNSIDPLVKSQFQGQYLANAIAAGSMPKYVCDNLCDVFADDDEVMKTVGIKILKDRINEGISLDTATTYIQLIKKHESSYQPPKVDTPTETVKSSNSGGCYVATAVYGSYDCPEVWTLRRFRDNTLAKSLFGRLFIYLYYAISPTLVKWFGENEWFKNMWKPILDEKVKKLNLNGVENTPYNDRQW